MGAVAYHPRDRHDLGAVPHALRRRGVPTDYILYSNYERLVAAVLDGHVEIGWNTNTAYVALDHGRAAERASSGCATSTRDWATVIVTRRGERRRRSAPSWTGGALALGSRDSGHAAILPLHYLAKQGLDVGRRVSAALLNTDLGKHGDTGDSELHVVTGGRRRARRTPARCRTAYFAAFRGARSPGGGRALRWSGGAPPTTTATSRCSTRSTRTSSSGGRGRCWRWTTTTPALRPAMDARERPAVAARRSGRVRLPRGGDARARAPGPVTAVRAEDGDQPDPDRRAP